jgi:eukaryotic translation initiation factor 2C
MPCVAYIDHLIREWPSQNFVAIKRSFYNEDANSKDLAHGVMCVKGIYQAIKVAEVRDIVVSLFRLLLFTSVNTFRSRDASW